MADPHRSDRVGRSVAPRLVAGSVLGATLGALLGLVIGLVAFRFGSTAMWGSTLAGGLFGAVIGAFWGGMTGLGPPAEEDDPLPRLDHETDDVHDRRAS